MSQVKYDFSGKNVLVIGGTTGIGRATVLAFARAGANLFVSGLGASDGRSLGEEVKGIGGAFEFREVDVRNGSAMTTELGILKIDGEIRTQEAEGSDPFLHIVMPRVLGMAVSTFCLTTIFIFVAFASGFLFAEWTGQGGGNLFLFANTLSGAVQPRDVLNILAKSILPALFAGASCCIGGLGVSGSVKEIPQATERALTRSVAGLFVISVVVSLLTYR